MNYKPSKKRVPKDMEFVSINGKYRYVSDSPPPKHTKELASTVTEERQLKLSALISSIFNSN